MPSNSQWDKWLTQSIGYIKPLVKYVCLQTDCTVIMLPSGGSAERCAVPFDFDHRCCTAQQLCLAGYDVTHLRSDHDAMLTPMWYAVDFSQWDEMDTYPSFFVISSGYGIPDGYARVVINEKTLPKWIPYCVQPNDDGLYYLATDSIHDLTLSAANSLELDDDHRGCPCRKCPLDRVTEPSVIIEVTGPAVKLHTETIYFPMSVMVSLCCCASACPVCCTPHALSDSGRRIFFQADLMISLYYPEWPNCAKEWVRLT